MGARPHVRSKSTPRCAILPADTTIASRGASSRPDTNANSAKIADVKRVVQGHTHREMHVHFRGVEVINNGTWSPAFHDVECTRPFGSKCFTWIRPEAGTGGSPGDGDRTRTARLYEWKDPGLEEIPLSLPEA